MYIYMIQSDIGNSTNHHLLAHALKLAINGGGCCGVSKTGRAGVGVELGLLVISLGGGGGLIFRRGVKGSRRAVNGYLFW